MKNERNKKIKKRKSAKTMKRANNGLAFGCIGLLILFIVALQIVITFVLGKLGH